MNADRRQVLAAFLKAHTALCVAHDLKGMIVVVEADGALHVLSPIAEQARVIEVAEHVVRMVKAPSVALMTTRSGGVVGDA